MPLNNGFNRKLFPKIKEEIEQSLVSTLGEVNLLPPSIFANIIAIFAEREANIWEQMEAVYNSAYPQTAEGYSLDGICALTGVVREKSTYSEAICQLTALNYTKIPAGSEISVKNSLNHFALVNDIVVTNEKCHSIKLNIANSIKEEYSVSINGKSVTYSKEEDKTGEEIANGLSKSINDADLGVIAKNVATEIDIIAKNHSTEFSCFISEGISMVNCTNNASVIATQKGSIAAPMHSLTKIRTPISGWLGVNNVGAAKIGNNIESDQDLRKRRATSIKLGGSGTVESIRANLLNLSGVTAVNITENATNALDEKKIPSHAFEVLVTGGEDLDIARLIWQKKPAGIQTHGNVCVEINDSEDRPQIVKFSRPVIQHIYAKVTITKLKEFNVDCVSAIKKRLAQQINKFGVGSNIILKSLFVSIFSEHGITNATIVLGATELDSRKPRLLESDLTIKPNEVALTDTSKIDIILEDF